MTGCRQEQCRHVYRPYSDDMNKHQAAYRLNTAHRQTYRQTHRQSGMNHLGNVTTRTHASCTETSLKRTRKATKSNITNTQHITNITTLSNWGRLNADIHPSPVGVLADRWWVTAACWVCGKWLVVSVAHVRLGAGSSRVWQRVINATVRCWLVDLLTTHLLGMYILTHTHTHTPTHLPPAHHSQPPSHNHWFHSRLKTHLFHKSFPP